jgi:hypothetical protein
VSGAVASCLLLNLAPSEDTFPLTKRRRPRVITDLILDFINIRTLQRVSLSSQGCPTSFMRVVASRLRRETETIYDLLKSFASRFERWREENGNPFSNMLSWVDEREGMKKFALNQEID